MRDNVTTPTLLPQLDHIVSQLGCCLRACDPTILAGPTKNLVSLAAVCPTPCRRTALLQRCVKLADKFPGCGGAIARLVPADYSRLGLCPGAVNNNNGFLRGLFHLTAVMDDSTTFNFF